MTSRGWARSSRSAPASAGIRSAGGVPVELVVILVGEDAAAHVVHDADRLLRVDRAGHPGLDRDGVVRVRHLAPEWTAPLVVDSDAAQGQRVFEPVTGVARRNPPEDSLMRPSEVEGDVLANDEAAVGVDDDAGDEAVDRE